MDVSIDTYFGLNSVSNSFSCRSRSVDVVEVIPVCRFFFPIAALPKADCLLRDGGVDDRADEDRAKPCRLCRCDCRCDIIRGWIIVDTAFVGLIVVVILPLPPIMLGLLPRVLVALLALEHGCKYRCRCDCVIVLVTHLSDVSTGVNAATIDNTSSTSTSRVMVLILVVLGRFIFCSSLVVRPERRLELRPRSSRVLLRNPRLK